MHIGPMRDRVRIDACITDRDTFNAPRRVWVPVWECAAEIKTLTAREWYSGTREEAANTVKIITRYQPKALDLTAEARAIDLRHGITYAITGILFDAKRTLLTLLCVTGQADG